MRRSLCAVITTVVGGGALCAQVPRLLAPQRSAFAAFPAADSYRVIVRDVDTAARRRLDSSLPFRVHFEQLGAHSLDVALRGDRPIGMICTQDEESAFGLPAVEWAITFDMHVSGFQFQRVRSRYRGGLERSEFVRLLKGRSRADLEAMVGEEGRLRQPAKGVRQIAKLRDLAVGME